ncbi:oxidoreductase-like protein [Whalleya microplaca]|nr:oxidoreductase-like protein [Whalleya microplaca]
MSFNTRPLVRAARLRSSAFQQPPQSHRAAFLSTGSRLPGGTPGEAASPAQATPLGPYYESILITPQPVPAVKPEEPPTSSPKSPRTTVRKAPAKKTPRDSNTNTNTSTSTSSASTTTTTSAAASTKASDKATDSASATKPRPAPAPSAQPASAQEKARIIFGSRLAGPAERAERLAALRDRSTLIAGVLVPPRPEEPDNCCMSGCVNCVWDRFRDDVEEWAAASRRAEAALQAQQRTQKQRPPTEVLGTEKKKKEGLDGPAGPALGMSMDDDGGGSETNWQGDLMKKQTDRPKIAKDLWDDDLYKNVPVGIREFMKQEKKLKEKHSREGSFGA